MSDAEDDLNFFGTPLEAYDEDAFPSKKPISIEEQVARDAQGRRRFHGAFTGGFSAGFYNTVGSLEGWKPQEFISSRNQKAQNVSQKPEDFMDDEDVGEFGIAPQVVRVTGDYANTKKRKKPIAHDGPIPGQPVLEGLLQAGNETVGYFLMKNISSKNRTHNEKSQPETKVYGCQMPRDLPSDEIYEDFQYELHEIYKHYLSNSKANTFGLGYIGLDKDFKNLNKSTNLTVHERNNKKLSISGQAFGVGAFEDEDDDIYMKDDMSKYDFELTSEKSKKQIKPAEGGKTILDIFVSGTKVSTNKSNFPPPIIPSSFTGKYKQKRSRFEPVVEATPVPERKNIDASVRARYLGETHTEKSFTPSNTQHSKAKLTEKEKPKEENKVNKFSPFPGLVLDRFVAAKQDDDPTNILEAVKPAEVTPHGTKEMHDAVKLKMFGPLTHVTIAWQPCSLLCKRFNIPEPNSELNQQKNKKRTKNLIFEYQKHVESDILSKPGLCTSNPIKLEEDQETKIIEPAKEELPSSSAPANVSTTLSNPNLSETLPEVQKMEIESNVNETIDITDRVDVAKNIDLFKAVFLSSSESESEEVEEEKEEEIKKRSELMATNVLTESLIPEIKIKKQGILSNLDFTKFNSVKVKNVSIEEGSSRKQPDEVVIIDDTYGPKVPTNLNILQRVAVKDVNDVDKWVEKGSKERKHKKKHKKEKHKKHKHKSKS